MRTEVENADSQQALEITGELFSGSFGESLIKNKCWTYLNSAGRTHWSGFALNFFARHEKMTCDIATSGYAT